MNSRILVTAVLVVITLGVTAPAQAQSAVVARLEGTFHDFTADLDSSGPWQLVGEWSGTLRASGRVDVMASLSMVRADNPTRQAHTHHVALTDGTVTAIAGDQKQLVVDAFARYHVLDARLFFETLRNDNARIEQRQLR